MAKAKRARRTSVRTMDTDPDALSMIERLEKLEAEQKASTPPQDEPAADEDEGNAA